MPALSFTRSRGSKGEVILTLEGDRPLELLMSPDIAAQVRDGALKLSVGYMQGKVKMVGSSGALMDLLPQLDAGDYAIDDA